jgi:hypothetical protein
MLRWGLMVLPNCTDISSDNLGMEGCYQVLAI